MLSAAIPCIWLMETELLERRTQITTYNPVEAIYVVGDIEFEAPDFVLFMEQILIFSLVIGNALINVFKSIPTMTEWPFEYNILGRWVAPKHEDHDSDDFSEILITSLGVGADILELLESFGDEKIGGKD